MKKWMLAICLMFINEFCQATDCFDLAGRDYKIDPDLLRAISWKESRYRVNAIGINPVTGYGSGLMQVDSQHFNELARYGIKPEHRHCCKVSDEAAFCLIQRPHISKTLLTRRISPRGSP